MFKVPNELLALVFENVEKNDLLWLSTINKQVPQSAFAQLRKEIDLYWEDHI